MALSWARPSHGGQDWFGQGRTSRWLQKDSTHSGLSNIGCLLPSHSRALFYQQISGYRNPTAVGILEPQSVSCSRGTHGHGLIHCHGSQVGAGTVWVGCSVVSLSGLGKGPGRDEALRYPISLARLTVNESFPESWNLGRNNSWLVMGQRRSWDKRDRHLITFWCALQPKMSYFTLLEFPKKKKIN